MLYVFNCSFIIGEKMKISDILKVTWQLAVVLLIITNLSFVESSAQDLFGKIQSPSTAYVSYAKANASGKIFAAVWGAGLYTSTDNGVNWTQNNTGLTCFYINSIEFARSNEVYLGTNEGIFKSTDNGNSWNPANNGLKHLHVKAVKLGPNWHMFAGTYGGGVYISKNNGQSWTRTIQGLHYMDITSIDVTTQNYIVVGTYGGGIYVSRDGGDTWMRQNSGLNNYFINDVKRSPFGYVYAATNGRGIYESVNGGLTWAELDTFMLRPITLDKEPIPDFNATVIAFNKNDKVAYGTRYGGIFVNDDVERLTWVPASNSRGHGTTALTTGKDKMLFAYMSSRTPIYALGIGDVFEDDRKHINPAPSSRIFYARNNRMFKIIDNGEVWETKDMGLKWNLLSKVNQKIKDFAMDSAGNFLVGTEKGLYVSDNSATSWTRIRFADTIVHSIQVTPDNHFFAGIQYFYAPEPPAQPIDKRYVFVTVNNGIEWINVTPNFLPNSDPPYHLIVTRNKRVYVSAGSSAFYTTDGGNRWSSTAPFGGKITSMYPGADGNVYVSATDGIYKSTSISEFTKLNSGLTYTTKVFADDSGRIYASGDYWLPRNYATSKTVVRSVDGGETFERLRDNFHAEVITSYFVDENNTFYMCGESGMIYRAIDPNFLKTPKVITPKDNAFDIENSQELLWHPSDKAELYQIEISTDNEFIFRFEHVTLADTSYNIQQAFTYNTKYFWRIRAKNHSAVSPWSQTFAFTSKIAPPVLISPVNDSVGVAVKAELVWQEVWGAQKYEVQISRTNDFSTIFHSDANVAGTQYTTPILDGLTKYYWRVRAINENSTSYWSEVWAFTTVLGPPRLIAPVNHSIGNDVSLAFVWHKALEAKTYNIKISKKADMSELIYEQTAIPDTLHNVSGLLFNTKYYWQISSSNEFGTSEWSDVWDFTTAYAHVRLVSPANNAVNQLIKPEFTWEEFGGPELYHLQIATDVEFKNLVLQDSIENALKYSTELTPFSKYFWRIRVEDDGNFGLWSDAWSLKTRLQAVGLRIPANGTKNLTSSVQFIWFALNNAIRYHLQIANDSEFNDLIFSQDTIGNVAYTFNQLPPNSTFYWRVRAYSEDGPGDWSPVWTFETGVGGPILVAPPNNSEYVPLDATFRWEPYNGAIFYEFMLGKDASFTSVIADISGIMSTTYTVNDLEKDTEYHWRVRAVLGDGKSDWSQTWFFNTGSANSISEYFGRVGAFPNPFSNYVQFEFDAKTFGSYLLEIYDATGRTLANINFGFLAPGIHKAIWQPQTINQGRYFYRISVGKISYTGEIIYVK